MAHYVQCAYCGVRFNRDKTVDWIQINSRRYAHIACHSKHLSEQSQDDKDLAALEEYIKQLFSIDLIPAKVRHQIKVYHDDNKYTYSGMLKSLTYFYNVKGNSIEKANGGIGIIPYIYQEAHAYYLAIWQANQTNQARPIEQYKTEEQVIVIPPPQRVEKKRVLFSFLDEEE